MNPTWFPQDATKDRQSVTADWQLTDRQLIEGVSLKEVRNVLCADRMVTEVFRRDWFQEPVEVDQIFQVFVQPGGVFAWHAHETTTDRLFVCQGVLKVVLYDGRENSTTRGFVNEFVMGLFRPQLLVVPCKVWHGIQNCAEQAAAILNAPDLAYQYEDPDHWRLPADTPHIPYRFQGKHPTAK